MAQQLIFTSAVAGLNPGSSGYCTVARSEAMREAVALRLERWSVYTHAAKGARPVICAHRILNLRGCVFHVLTRLADSGLDYTGRTNFIAHHLVLQPHEIHGGCSPAEVFMQWTGWRSQWQGQPCYVDDAEFSLHAIPRTTQLPARAWAEAAGDAGAAALLVSESRGHVSAKSADLVVPVGKENGLLRLYAESLRLAELPDDNGAAAWAIPFTTHFQPEDDPADCKWRGFWIGDPRPPQSDLLVDLANGAVPRPSAGLLADYARTGRRRVIEASSEPSAPFASSSEATLSSLSGAPLRHQPALPGRAAAPHSAENGAIPRWVWITCLCVVPIGLIAGFLLARESPTTGLKSPPASEKEYAAQAEHKASSEVASKLFENPKEATATPTPDTVTAEQKERLNGLIQRLKAEKLVDPKSPVQKAQADEVANLERSQREGEITEASLKTSSAKVDEILLRIDAWNRNFQDQQILKNVPNGTVYVLSGADPVLKFSDPTNRLNLWLSDIRAGKQTPVAYRVGFHHLYEKTHDGSPGNLVLEENGNLASDTPNYHFQVGQITRDQADVAGPMLISFFPGQANPSLEFHFLLGTVAGIVVPRVALDERDPLTIQFTPTIKNALEERFKEWKDGKGTKIAPHLEVRLKGENEYKKADNLTFDFKSLRTQFDKVLSEANDALRKAETAKTDRDNVKRNIDADRDFLCNQLFEGKTVKNDGKLIRSANQINGSEYYNGLGNLIQTVCEDSPDARDVLPGSYSADNRVKLLEAAPEKLGKLAQKKSKLSGRFSTLASDLSKINWQRYADFLNGKDGVKELDSAAKELDRAQAEQSKAATRQSSAPDRSKADKVTIGAEVNGVDLSLIEIDLGKSERK